MQHTGDIFHSFHQIIPPKNIFLITLMIRANEVTSRSSISTQNKYGHPSNNKAWPKTWKGGEQKNKNSLFVTLNQSIMKFGKFSIYEIITALCFVFCKIIFAERTSLFIIYLIIRIIKWGILFELTPQYLSILVIFHLLMKVFG